MTSDINDILINKKSKVLEMANLNYEIYFKIIHEINNSTKEKIVQELIFAEKEKERDFLDESQKKKEALLLELANRILYDAGLQVISKLEDFKNINLDILSDKKSLHHFRDMEFKIFEVFEKKSTYYNKDTQKKLISHFRSLSNQLERYELKSKRVRVKKKREEYECIYFFKKNV